MEGITDKLKINDFTSLSQLKRKFKSYLEEQGCDDIKQSDFPRTLVYVSVMLLEEILSDCLKLVTKDSDGKHAGCYVINLLILHNSLSDITKYDFLIKYNRKYNNKIRYQESLFFNIKKVFDSLETKYGEKLMIDQETRNYITYLLLSLQYDITDLCVRVIKFANKKTLNKNALLCILGNYMNDGVMKKFQLKLDSLMSNKDTDAEVDDNTEDDDKIVETDKENDETVEA
jgi:hypothetical protein